MRWEYPPLRVNNTLNGHKINEHFLSCKKYGEAKHSIVPSQYHLTGHGIPPLPPPLTEHGISPPSPPTPLQTTCKENQGWLLLYQPLCSVVLGHTVKTVCLQYSVIFITVQKLFIINISEVSVTTLKKVSKTESLLKI